MKKNNASSSSFKPFSVTKTYRRNSGGGYSYDKRLELPDCSFSEVVNDSDNVYISKGKNKIAVVSKSEQSRGGSYMQSKTIYYFPLTDNNLCIARDFNPNLSSVDIEAHKIIDNGVEGLGYKHGWSKDYIET